jgi:hypothetical protein
MATIFISAWVVSVALCCLIWIKAGAYGKFRWAIRAVAIGLLVRPVLFGFAPVPAYLGIIGYTYDIWISGFHDMMNDFRSCRTAALHSILIVWITLEILSQFNLLVRKYSKRNNKISS